MLLAGRRVLPRLHPRAMSFRTSVDADNYITLSPASPTAAVVFLHGLGDSAHGWADAMAVLAKKLPHIKFVLPSARAMPVTLNMGMRMPAWYDIKSLSKVDDDSADGIESTRDLVLDLIAKEVAGGIPYNRIVLGGFSQGAATSLFTGYQSKNPLAGVLCMSGYLPKSSSFQLAPETAGVPLLMCHGEMDPVVRFQYGKMSKEKLQAAGVTDVTFCTYPDMEHSASMDELDDVKTWLERVIPNN